MIYNETISNAKAVKERIDAATTSDNKWNNWPDKLEVVAVKRYDLKDAAQAYEAGRLKGYAAAVGEYRQINPARLLHSIGVREAHPVLFTNFIPANAQGQGDDIAKRNILAVFEESVQGDWRPRNLVTVELGCKHEYEVKTPFSCYREGKCKRCGHTWSCDSSG